MRATTLKQVQLKRLRKASDDDRPAQVAQLAVAFLRVHPDHAPTWIMLGRVLVEMARYTEALRALRRAIHLCPPNKIGIAYGQMGHLYKQRGNFARAAHWYRQAIAAEPTEADGYIFLGGLLARGGNLREAERQHRRAIRCETGCLDEAYLNLGLVLRAQQRFPEAAQAFRKALELDPRYTEARCALADIQGLSQPTVIKGGR